jgi:hypothetical protein
VKISDFVGELWWREVLLELRQCRRQQRNDAMFYGQRK